MWAHLAIAQIDHATGRIEQPGVGVPLVCRGGLESNQIGSGAMLHPDHPALALVLIVAAFSQNLNV